MKASEMVMLVLTRGILTEKRELTATIITASTRKRRSTFGAGNHNVDSDRQVAPTATIIQR